MKYEILQRMQYVQSSKNIFPLRFRKWGVTKAQYN
jgi:hypothetical protein